MCYTNAFCDTNCYSHLTADYYDRHLLKIILLHQKIGIDLASIWKKLPNGGRGLNGNTSYRLQVLKNEGLIDIRYRGRDNLRLWRQPRWFPTDILEEKYLAFCLKQSETDLLAQMMPLLATNEGNNWETIFADLKQIFKQPEHFHQIKDL